MRKAVKPVYPEQPAQIIAPVNLTEMRKHAMSSSLFKHFKMDSKKECDGVVVKYPVNSDGTEPTFKIARMGRSNINYSKALDRETRPYRRQIELEMLDEKTAQKIQVKVFVDSVLLGWENVQDAEGKTMEFNSSNAITLLEALPDLYADLAAQAQKAVLFRDDAMESDAKN